MSAETSVSTILKQAEAIQGELGAQHAEHWAMSALPQGPILAGQEEWTLEEARFGDANFSDLIGTGVLEPLPILKPWMVIDRAPLTEVAADTVRAGRQAAQAIVQGRSDRLLAITGPCSVHDPEELLEYMGGLQELRSKHQEDLEVILRLYFEKPRTLADWGGLLYDPQLDKTHNINLGIIASRLLALRVAESGMPAATERLNTTDMPIFFEGLFAYDAIGARNVTDSRARQYASSTSSVVGLKNSLDGTIEYACDAITVANTSNYLMGSDIEGNRIRFRSKGNPYAHLILRGGADGPNYSPEHVAHAITLLGKRNLLPRVVIDCSHGNSGKNPERQLAVATSIAKQVSEGQGGIVGAMIESYIHGGKQLLAPREQLRAGVSVTDACVALAETAEILAVLAEGVRKRRNRT